MIDDWFLFSLFDNVLTYFESKTLERQEAICKQFESIIAKTDSADDLQHVVEAWSKLLPDVAERRLRQLCSVSTDPRVKKNIEQALISVSKSPLSIDIDTKAIRDLLVAAFDDVDLMALCFDRFYLVYNEKFGIGMGKGEKIQLLLDYCVRHELIDALLELVKERNPNQYDIYAEHIFTGRKKI